MADLQHRVQDVSSDESTQERVGKALLRELEQLKLVENLQALSSDLKTTATKLEDRVQHQGEHLERFFTDQLANHKTENDRNLNYQVKEVVTCHVGPLAKSRGRLLCVVVVGSFLKESIYLGGMDTRNMF